MGNHHRVRVFFVDTPKALVVQCVFLPRVVLVCYMYNVGVSR